MGELGVPLRTHAVATIKELNDKVSEIDPDVDRVVLIHVLSAEALDLAKVDKSDVEKGVDSDNAANKLCDLVEDIVERVPYLRVLVSMLTPRFDLQDATGMGYPNNVRKVMNVQIGTRFYNSGRVSTLNNDSVLEWWKDEVKRDKLLRPAGTELTAYGFGVLLDFWVSEIRDALKKEGILSETSAAAGKVSEQDDSDQGKANESDAASIPKLEDPFNDLKVADDTEVKKNDEIPAAKTTTTADEEDKEKAKTTTTAAEEEFKEKENEEKMEKELSEAQ